MAHTIYADSLLAVNFSMDFLALYISARLMNMPIRPLRLAAGAAIGSLFALSVIIAEYCIPHQIFTVILIAGSILCALIMSACAFGGKIVRTALTYGAVNIGLGGVMTALYSIVGRVSGGVGAVNASANPTSSPLTFIIISLMSAGVSLMYGKFKKQSADRQHILADISIFGNKFSLTLLCDTGNLLRDPFGNKPVLVVSAKSLENSMPPELIGAVYNIGNIVTLPEPVTKRIRMIPADSVTGGGMLIGFVPDYICIDGRTVDALIAISAQNTDYGGCDGIIPKTLIYI